MGGFTEGVQNFVYTDFTQETYRHVQSKKKHDVPEELLASLLANYQKPEDLIGEEELLMHLTRLVVGCALEHFDRRSF